MMPSPSMASREAGVYEPGGDICCTGFCTSWAANPVDLDLCCSLVGGKLTAVQASFCSPCLLLRADRHMDVLGFHGATVDRTWLYPCQTLRMSQTRKTRSPKLFLRQWCPKARPRLSSSSHEKGGGPKGVVCRSHLTVSDPFAPRRKMPPSLPLAAGPAMACRPGPSPFLKSPGAIVADIFAPLPSLPSSRPPRRRARATPPRTVDLLIGP